jgi:hypothetical protein
MYATVTRLTASDEAHRERLTDGLASLLDDVADAPELLGAYVLATGEREVALVTVYASESAAELLGARFRPRLAERVGPHLAGPPQRLAGPVVMTIGDGRISG